MVQITNWSKKKIGLKKRPWQKRDGEKLLEICTKVNEKNCASWDKDGVSTIVKNLLDPVGCGLWIQSRLFPNLHALPPFLNPSFHVGFQSPSTSPLILPWALHLHNALNYRSSQKYDGANLTKICTKMIKDMRKLGQGQGCGHDQNPIRFDGLQALAITLLLL